MLDAIKKNCRKPRGFFGKLIIRDMNKSHRSLHDWGFSMMELRDGMKVLDVGCGGGEAIGRFLRLMPSSVIYGLDYSATSVAAAKKANKKAVAAGRAVITEGDIMALPYPDGTFDVITSFENYYFWPDITEAARGLRAAMKDGGVLYIVGEGHDTGRKNEHMEHMVELMDMQYPTAADFKARLMAAGFSSVKVTTRDENAGGWIFAVCEK